MSLGGGGPSSTERDAFQTFFDDGILIVASAGNGGSSSYSYPASYSSVMSVAATDSSDAKASFSQFNDEVDIAAPGVDVVSTVGAAPVREGRSAAALPPLSRDHCLLPRPPERHWGRPPGL